MGAVGSTLEEACDQYVGRTLVVEPHNGWGWFHQEARPFLESRGVPPPFRLEVVRVYTYKGERRGVLARVREPGFLYDGFWLVGMTRHRGVWIFTDRPAHYNLLLCPQEPIQGKPEDSPYYGELWPVWHLQGRPQASGIGRIAESLQWCADHDATQDAEARRQAGPNAVTGGAFRYIGTIVSKRG
jgi:hypothetical protein